MTISWGGVQVMDKSDPINLPATVTVALRHKIMTRRIAQQLGEVQYMLKQGFIKLHMPRIYACLMKRHPILDPKPPVATPQNGPQPGTSGQMSPKPEKYLSLESVALSIWTGLHDKLT